MNSSNLQINNIHYIFDYFLIQFNSSNLLGHLGPWKGRKVHQGLHSCSVNREDARPDLECLGSHEPACRRAWKEGYGGTRTEVTYDDDDNSNDGGWKFEWC